MAASALIGLLRGLVREVLSLVIWVSAILGALTLGPPVADWLALDSRLMSVVAGYAIVFLAIIVFGSVAQKLVAKAVDATGLSGADRLLGLAFGGARGLAICLAAFLVMRPFAHDAAWWQAALAPPLLAEFVDELLNLLDSVDPVPSTPTVEAF